MALTSPFSVRPTWATCFQYRDFRLLWGAILFNALAFGMEQVALGWLVLEMTDSPFMVGVSAAARMSPFFFLGIVSGAVADRVDRRLFVRYATASSSIVAGLMALVLLTNSAQVWHIMVLAAATGCTWAFTLTVKQAYTYDIVGPANALNGLSLAAVGQRVGGVAGALVGGAILATVSAGGVYIAVAASQLAAVAILMATRDVGQAASTQREPVLQNLIGYFQLIRQNRTLMVLMVLAGMTELFGFTHQTLLPVFAKDVLGVGAMGLGVMTAIRQVGGIVGLLALASLGDFRRKGLLMFIVAAAFGLGQMALSLSDNLLLFLLVLSFISACASAVDTLYQTLMQSNVRNEERGRATGSWVLSIGVAPAGHVSIGWIAGVLGAPGAILINGSVLTFVGLASALGLPRVRRLP